jgi:hypothetical protein
MTFPEFIRTRRATMNDRGAFISDAQKDRTLPDAKDWPELKLYLQQEKAIPEAIRAAKKVWSEFNRWRRAAATTSKTPAEEEGVR